MSKLSHGQRIGILERAIHSLQGFNTAPATLPETINQLHELHLDMIHDPVSRPQWEHRFIEWEYNRPFPYIMSELEKEGWELVSVDYIGTGRPRQGYFKRQKL